MALAGAYGATDESEAKGVLERCLDLGINHFDTADVYGAGHNESLVGWLAKRHRDRMFIATKGGSARTADGRVTNDGRPDHLKRACDASLGRLGIEQIDLYYLHRADPQVPIEESVGALADLVAAGKIRSIGLSEVSADTLRRAHRAHPVAALQSEYSVGVRDVANALLPVCRELGILFVAYSPLGRGLWTAQIPGDRAFEQDDIRSGIPRFSAQNLSGNVEFAAGLQRIAQSRGITAAQLALSWLLSGDDDIVVIPGTRSIGRLEENAAAADIHLSAEVIAAVTDCNAASILGARHSERMLARTGL
jgi:aryl-alcohol dehydrogenase-like predicted oxidoreductase